MVEVADVGVLRLQGDMGIAGAGVAGVVERGRYFPGALLGDLQYRIDFIVLVAALQLQCRLLARVLVGQLQARGYFAEVGRLARAQTRQAAPDVCFVMHGVAFNLDRTEFGFDYLQLDHALVQLLLRQRHLHHVVTQLAVFTLQRFERALHVAEVAALSHIWRNRLLHRRCRQQRIAVHIEARNVEANNVRRTGIGSTGRGACRCSGSANQQAQ